MRKREFNLGDKVRVLTPCDDAWEATGWPCGLVGVIVPKKEDSECRPLVRFPGETRGHDGEYHMEGDNREHWYITEDFLVHFEPPPLEPLAQDLLNDYRLDMANTDT